MIRSAFFSIGFRPFFASGIVFCTFALIIWGGYWQPGFNELISSKLNPVGNFLFWHPHELIMGFALAIIMGFLLTAARNWTGLDTAPPVGLFILWLFWLNARFIMLLGHDLPSIVILISQIIVPLLAAMFIARPIIIKRMWRNLFAPIILVLFAAFETAIIMQLSDTKMMPSQLFHASILLIVVMITMIGGRIIPLFTANKLGIDKPVETKVSFLAALIPLIILLMIKLLPINDTTHSLSIACCAILFIAHSVRLKNWHHKGIWKQPMLWSLWTFYASLPLAFLIMAIEPILDNWITLGSIPIHILGIGTILGLCISMVSRVSLGHTGRVIIHDHLIVSAFALLIASLLVRTLFIATLGLSGQLIMLSALLAATSCLLIFIRFIAIWLTPRN